jgi:GT2 family glycosyltransferase
VAAAAQYGADLVSFKVVNANDPGFVWTEAYRTGLLTFYGCAVLIRRSVLEALGGYDPEIFVFANELEFMLRFFDRGFRHLHFPDVVAQHMKPSRPPSPDGFYFLDEKLYKINNRHWAYIAAKLLRPRDAAETIVALLARNLRDGLRAERHAFSAIPETVRGLFHGLRHRAPVRNAELSRFYRRNFESFASPWWLSRSPLDLARRIPREILREGLPERTSRGLGRRERYFRERARFYPDHPETLQF